MDLHGLHRTESSRGDRGADQVERIRIGDRHEKAYEKYEGTAERQADDTEELRGPVRDPIETVELG